MRESGHWQRGGGGEFCHSETQSDKWQIMPEPSPHSPGQLLSHYLPFAEFFSIQLFFVSFLAALLPTNFCKSMGQLLIDNNRTNCFTQRIDNSVQTREDLAIKRQINKGEKRRPSRTEEALLRNITKADPTINAIFTLMPPVKINSFDRTRFCPKVRPIFDFFYHF